MYSSREGLGEGSGDSRVLAMQAHVLAGERGREGGGSADSLLMLTR